MQDYDLYPYVGNQVDAAVVYDVRQLADIFLKEIVILFYSSNVLKLRGHKSIINVIF